MAIEERVKILRGIMKEKGVDFYLAPSTDQHNNEYVPSCWQRRPWISGFDGSAGEVLVGHDCGFLWTDGRYFLQAEQQLDPNLFKLKKQQGFASELEQWLEDNIHGKVLAVDPKLISIKRAQRLVSIVESRGGKLEFIETNLIDLVKEEFGELSSQPSADVVLYDIQHSGCSTQDKIANLQAELKACEIQSIIISSLDEIAWLYNIRGNDIEFNPLTISYAIVDQAQAFWFLDTKKTSAAIISTLEDQGVVVGDYETFAEVVKQLKTSVWLDANVTSFWIENLLSDEIIIHLARSPIVLSKACKNNVEIDGTKSAHKIDAVAVIKFLHWIKNNWRDGIDELKAISQLQSFRAESTEYKGNSFDTISGFASNGAIIHYRSTPETSKTIDDSALFLLDSGGQYLGGTTDITRTMHLGQPNAEEKKHYTLVLKGHLQLKKAIFPYGTTGEQLDVLARLAIWKEHMNYRHGTGHGVGSFLCVHEGPQRISSAPSGVPLEAGMIVSNEPGLYVDNKHGVRIENLMFVKQVCAIENSQTQDGPFYGFEDVTLVPYAQNLIDKYLLTAEEIEWVNQYHKLVWNKIYPSISDKNILAWLHQETRII